MTTTRTPARKRPRLADYLLTPPALDGPPRAVLDAYGGAGGAGTGYWMAGFARVVGVDIEPQRRYPADFEFVRADARDVLAGLTPLDVAAFDLLHASPICKGYSNSSVKHRARGKVYPDDLPEVRTLLEATGRPWVIENVRGAPMRADLVCCGCMFPELAAAEGYLVRERLFETSWHAFALRSPCYHVGPGAITVAGHAPDNRRAGRVSESVRSAVMGNPWMGRDELAQSLPWRYCHYVGGFALDELGRAAA